MSRVGACSRSGDLLTSQWDDNSIAQVSVWASEERLGCREALQSTELAFSLSDWDWVMLSCIL